MKIGFIGAGNMGGAILRGALSAGAIKSEDTCVFGVNREKLANTASELGITPYEKISSLVKDCDVFFIGVKPQIFDEVLPQIADGLKSSGELAKDKVIVSMAAGIPISLIEKHLGKDAKIIRIMPNTPSQVGEGMTSVSRNQNVTDAEISFLMTIFSGIGKAEEVPEDLIHTVIGVSGSSPAYTFMYIDALINEAVAEGMAPDKARVFAAQAVLGAAKMVLESELEPSVLCKNVCSPGGTTIEAVKVLTDDGLAPLVSKAFRACTDKSKILSGEK